MDIKSLADLGIDPNTYQHLISPETKQRQIDKIKVGLVDNYKHTAPAELQQYEKLNIKVMGESPKYNRTVSMDMTNLVSMLGQKAQQAQIDPAKVKTAVISPSLSSINFLIKSLERAKTTPPPMTTVAPPPAPAASPSPQTPPQIGQ